MSAFHSYAWPTQYPVTLQELERRIDGIFRDLEELHNDISILVGRINSRGDAQWYRMNALEIRLQKLEGKDHA